MAGGGTYRGIYSKWVDELDFQVLTPPARHTLLTLRLCPQNNAASIFRYYPEVLRSQTGYPAEILDAALAELECSPSLAAPWIYREWLVVWIRNGLRHDPNIRLADPKHKKAVERAVESLPKLGIVARFCDYYRIPRPFDGPSEALGRVSEGGERFGLRVEDSTGQDRRISFGRVSEGPSEGLCPHVKPGEPMCDACAAEVERQREELKAKLGVAILKPTDQADHERKKQRGHEQVEQLKGTA